MKMVEVAVSRLRGAGVQHWEDCNVFRLSPLSWIGGEQCLHFHPENVVWEILLQPNVMASWAMKVQASILFSGIWEAC